MNVAYESFFKKYNSRKHVDRSILELGTKRWGQKSTHHKKNLPHYSSYVMVDFLDGEDVDVVCDAHELSKNFKENSLDVVWSSSTFEHLHSPWVAANEILKVLKPGGLFWIQTHFCFPEHGYPNDYFRYTTQGLEKLFSGAASVVSCYEFAVKMTPVDPAVVWNPAAPAWLNVCLSGEK